ncbi:MAG: hypothetical protein ABJN04_02145 [Hyphomicrobiales bacterium]
MDVLEIKTQGELEAWFDERPLAVAQVVAARAALRVLPYIVEEKNAENFASNILLPVFWAVTTSWVASKYPTHDVDAFAFAFASSASAIDAAASASASASAAFAAFAASAASDASAAFAAASVWKESLQDCAFLDDAIEQGGEVEHAARDLAGQPLWRTQSMPEETHQRWNEFKAFFSNADDNWQMWWDWYQARLDGSKTIDVPSDLLEDLDVRIATLDEELWKQGPAVVNAKIQELMDEAFREAKEREAVANKDLENIPAPEPASIKPVWQNDFLTLPTSPAKDDLSGASIEAAFGSLIDQVEDVIQDISSETNVDPRVLAYLEKLRDKIPTEVPNERTLFSLGHDQEKLGHLVRSQSEEWSADVAAGMHSLHLQFERIIDKFPEWRAFKASHGRDAFSEDEIKEISIVAENVVDQLEPLVEQGAVDSEIVSALRGFANVLVSDSTPEEILIGNDLLVADFVEGLNNTLKSLASWALKKLKIFAKSLNSGVEEVAEQAGRDATMGIYKLIKNALKIIVYGGSVTTGVAVPIAALIPKTFEWLQPVLKSLLGI